jgi:hypothetical protein
LIWPQLRERGRAQPPQIRNFFGFMGVKKIELILTKGLLRDININRRKNRKAA